jgi:cob(I)alamin adenosyltransferase
MKIYTKTGDKGKTRLVGGSIASKADQRIEAYGTVDELNSILGLITTECSDHFVELQKKICRIQNELFNLGSILACEHPEMLAKLPQISEIHIHQLESEIDQMDKVLAPLKNFILPGGSKLSALFHLARTVCRRAERHTVKLNESTKIEESSLIYLNRLSDYLFVAARFCNHHLKIHDVEWTK